MALKRTTPFAQVDPNSAGNTARGDAEMPVKAFVLGRDDRIFQMRRNCFGSDLAAKLFATPRIDLTVAIQKCDRTA